MLPIFLPIIAQFLSIGLVAQPETELQDVSLFSEQLTPVTMPTLASLTPTFVPLHAAPSAVGSAPVQLACGAPASQVRTLAFIPLDALTVGGRGAAPPIWLTSRSKPAQSFSLMQPGRNAPLELWRENDGLFYVTGSVNGQIVRFLVDTGASMIVLTPDDARRVGAVANADGAINAETANGNSRMAKVTLTSMHVGTTGAAAVPAAVAQDGLKVSLLGQNWLSHLGSVRIEGDRMLLE